METCYKVYNGTATGLGVERVNFAGDRILYGKGSKYLLRPETVESLFYFYYFTRDVKYRE